MKKVIFYGFWGETTTDMLKRYSIQTPGNSGIWEDIQHINFPTAYQGTNTEFMKSTHVDGTRKPGTTYILEVNTEHHDFDSIDEADEDQNAMYIYKLTVQELILLDHENKWGKIFKDPDKLTQTEILDISKMTFDKYTDDKFINDV